MTAALRKQAERRRRAARGEVALSGWLSAEDHAALTQMAREAGMTQAQVIARLIEMRSAVLGLERFYADFFDESLVSDPTGGLVCHSDLTAAVGFRAEVASEGVKEGGK